MKNSIFSLLVAAAMLTTFSANAQTDSAALAKKQKEIEKSEKAISNAQSKVDKKEKKMARAQRKADRKARKADKKLEKLRRAERKHDKLIRDTSTSYLAPYQSVQIAMIPIRAEGPAAKPTYLHDFAERREDYITG